MSTTPRTRRWSRLRTTIATLLAPLGWRFDGPKPSDDRASQRAQWAQLTRLATHFFEARGLRAEHPGAPWPMAGERVLRKGAHRYLVHAGQWRAQRVDAATVQALMRAVSEQDATAGILLCARSVLTPAARELARENAILLLEPSQLLASAPKPGERRSVAAPLATGAQAAAAPQPAPARRPTLRPDHELGGRRDFLPTVPMSPSEVGVR